ncbi:metallophosphoesterase [Bifidobacterium gallicum]|uniref:Ser/Thr phosphatase family protein n=1 Tax=Bifidobacterium gallicum DSM 20093 = LMG 11596 TaxID=561180 RepID=D1NUI6_9BIFI|nr:metallophosphoesterase [Bifidobacterium gallicum]EFA23390.1 Ser/Thr phosphatase family protein [Bifidobacterium gallicum DSM 20093 = LMG 11596]KFI57858.1 ser/threonine protein phosphatase [Bifidobacterium gallicum DSM 20093 = LMG 11596]
MTEHIAEPQPGVLSVSARLGRLQFHHSGKFRVLQLADVQDGPKVSKDTIRLIEVAVKTSRPDIVIFTGNQIAGYDPAYAATYRQRRWPTRRNARVPRDPNVRQADLDLTITHVRDTISQFTAPLAQYGIPWAVTYGNHDFQCGLSNAQMDAIYREFPGCINPEPPALDGEGAAQSAAQSSAQSAATDPSLQPRLVPALPKQVAYACEAGTFALPVSSADPDHKTVFGLVLLDSGDYARAGGYGSPSKAALEFLNNVPSRFGNSARSMVFQHLPVPQYYELLEPSTRTAAHAVEGYRNFSGQYYVLDEAAVEPGCFVGEGISCPDVDCGEFDLLVDSRSYFAMAAGHDHRNAIDGLVHGIRLIATPTCGFGSYGPVPAKRAARLLEFDIRHPFSPRSQLLEFGELVGKPSSKKAYAYGMTSASKPESEGIDLLHKPGLFARLRRLFIPSETKGR